MFSHLLAVVAWSTWGLFLFGFALGMTKQVIRDVLRQYLTDKREFIKELEEKYEKGSALTSSVYH